MFNLKISNQAACQPVILPGNNSDDASVSTKHSSCSRTDVTASMFITKQQQTRAALKLIMLDDQKYQRQHSKRNFQMKKTKHQAQNNKLSSNSSHSVSSYSSAISVLSETSWEKRACDDTNWKFEAEYKTTFLLENVKNLKKKTFIEIVLLSNYRLS